MGLCHPTSLSDGEVLQVVRAGIRVAEIVAGAAVVTEVDTQKAVREDRVREDGVAEGRGGEAEVVAGAARTTTPTKELKAMTLPSRGVPPTV